MIVNTPDHVSETFWRTKKNGGFRMILNLNQTFNGFLKFKHCKLESVEDALDLTTECCYFMSVELKDASYTISIHQNYQKILRLFWKEEYYDYVVLTNGFSSESLQMFWLLHLISKVKGTFVRKIYWWLTIPGRDFWDLFQDY